MSHREKDKQAPLHGMRVIGIDPGSRICGYGIIEPDTVNRHSYVYVASGRIESSARRPLSDRLREIYSTLVDIIREYRPAVAVVEKVFFAKGVKAALSLGHARGISLLAAATEGLPIFEYSATEVKKAIAGYGRAEKDQVHKMVKTILDTRTTLSPDSADALALSLCHLNTLRFPVKIR